MPGSTHIRRRIKSVKNTSQITKAMEKVAQAKMAKAQQAALAAFVCGSDEPRAGRGGDPCRRL